MPRVGMNPLRYQTAPAHFPEILLAVITHLPNLEAYHARRLEVVQKCLTTMRAGGNGNPVMVWDNGSGGALREWLQEEYKPEYLVLGPNVGKDSARAALLRMVPPETILSLTDDDIEFLPGWLDAHLQLLKGFPNVGAVSGWPVRMSFRWGNTNALKWAKRHATVEEGWFIPDEWVKDYWLSVGNKNVSVMNSPGHPDYRITYNGLQAYAEAQHCQLVCYAGRIAPLAQYSNLGTGHEKEFDERIDAAGLLRLTTIERYTRHMGNMMDE